MLARILILLMAALQSGEPIQPPVVGTWVYAEKWHRWPRETRTRWTRAIVARFCPNGYFVLTKCILYEHKHSYSLIGKSDGLEIYRGKWSCGNQVCAVSYSLAEYEIPFTGVEDAMSKKCSAEPVVKRGKLRMDVIDLLAEPERYYPIKFSTADELRENLDERFIECRQPN